MPDSGSDVRSLASALDAVFALVLELPNSPHVRELRVQAQTYDRVLVKWESVPATGIELDALLDLVTDLHGRAAAAKRRTQPEDR
jgi:hypothetical protein